MTSKSEAHQKLGDIDWQCSEHTVWIWLFGTICLAILAPPSFLNSTNIERKQNGGLVKGQFWRMCPRSSFIPGEHPNVPSLRFFVAGTSKCTLVPVFVPGEHPPKPAFLKTALLRTPDNSSRICPQARHIHQMTHVGLLGLWLCSNLDNL